MPALDVNQIKSMLNLPDTASDIELVTALVELVGNLQQKYDALLSDAVTLEDKVVNRDLEDFNDVVDASALWPHLPCNGASRACLKPALFRGIIY